MQVVINGLPGADAGPDLLLTCAEPFMELGGTMASGSDLEFLWTSATGAFPGDSTEMHPFITEPGTFTLTVTDLSTGCSDADVVVVTAALDAPMPAFSLLPVSCFGDADGAIIVDSVVGGAPPYVYSLNDEPFTSTPAFLGLEASSYTLVVEDINGCQNEVITIDISQPQELVVDLVAIVNAEDNVVTLGDSVSLNAFVTLPEEMIDSVQWSPAELVSCDTCLNTMATPLETTSFSVTVSSNGCADSDNLNLLVRKNLEIYVPTGFSPDGDGVNDLFYPFAGPQVESIESFLVFNRWGETVFQYYQFFPNDPAFGWDGTHRGKLLDNAVFTWFAEVKLIDGRTEIFKGDVALIR
ncbi:MAG: gliding motility-associated C-terminal domain-containing protein [Bacteroidota bacterium]